jgi:hypothetical protein
MIARWRRRFGTSPLIAALLLGDPGGCEEAPSSAASGVTVEATTGRLPLQQGAGVTYELAWDWTGASVDEPTGARSWTTRLGYALTVERLYIATTSLALVPCGEVASRGRGLGLFSPREARADHAYAYDTTLVTTALAQLASDGAAAVFGRGVSPGQTYCQLHAISGPVAAEAQDGFRLQGWSAYLRGSYRQGDGAPVAFEGFVGLAQGTLRPLRVNVDPSRGTDVRILLTRRPVEALDTLDFAALSPAELAFEALGRLGATATADVGP